MRTRRGLGVFASLLAGLLVQATEAGAQLCSGAAQFEACLDAVGGVPASGGGTRDPTRVVDDVFRTNDTPPRYAPQLTFGRFLPSGGGVGFSGATGCRQVDPRMYTANDCSASVPLTDPGNRMQLLTYSSSLDWLFIAGARQRNDGIAATDLSDCGGNMDMCGYNIPWSNGFTYDLQGPANRVVIFPITDHNDVCLEAFEYSVYLTNDPTSRSLVAAGERPDPARWNRAVLVRAFLRGWTNNYQSTGTVADMTAHPLSDGRGTANEAVADSIATVWALPCGINFRYAAVIPGNYGNPDGRCAFHSADDEFDAVAGLNEDGTAICADRDMDGFRDAACGGNDCNDMDPLVNPGATEDCRSTRDLNCDGHVTACPTDLACVGGLCVTQCVEGACAEGFDCQRQTTPSGSFCVPHACAMVSCPAGQSCGPRGCQAPCDGAVCPIGQVCRGGACTDLCGGVMCPSNQHCEAGVCQPNCSCAGCAAPLACNTTSGRCESPACGLLPCPVEQRNCAASPPRCASAFCDGVVCPLGQRCDATMRACVPDRCFGISCQPGFACTEGRCVAMLSDAGATEGGAADSGSGDGGAADSGAQGDGGVADARATDSGAARDGGNTTPNMGSCGCRTMGAPSRQRAAGLALAALLVGAGSRRRRRSRG